jgi:endonuclease III
MGVIGARDLGIDLASGRERELFRWFLACLLFGKPIQQEVARRAYQELVQAGLATPRAIVEAGWDRLVEVLDQGHYVRFDFSTATKLLEVCRALLDDYGSVGAMFRRARSRSDLSRRLQAFKGVGPTTTRIFLRDTGFPLSPARRRRLPRARQRRVRQGAARPRVAAGAGGGREHR